MIHAEILNQVTGQVQLLWKCCEKVLATKHKYKQDVAFITVTVQPCQNFHNGCKPVKIGITIIVIGNFVLCTFNLSFNSCTWHNPTSMKISVQTMYPVARNSDLISLMSLHRHVSGLWIPQSHNSSNLYIRLQALKYTIDTVFLTSGCAQWSVLRCSGVDRKD